MSLSAAERDIALCNMVPELTPSSRFIQPIEWETKLVEKQSPMEFEKTTDWAVGAHGAGEATVGA
jgi:hypothetical protein